MSDDTIFREDTIRDVFRKKFTNSPKIEKTLRWVIVIALVILGGELIMILIINPCLPLSKIEVMGMPELDKAMVLEKAGITDKSSYVSVNTHAAEMRLATLAVVESVKITKRFPDSVRIILQGRKAVAVSFVMIDGQARPVFFDKQGMVFMIGNEEHTVRSLSIPIISGLIYEEPFVGMQVSVMFGPLLSNLDLIHSAAPELLAAISEIEIRRNMFDGYDLILYPVHNSVKIRLGADLNEYMLRYVLLVVDVCVARGVKVKEIDFRTGTASYTIKEASSG